MKKTIIIICTVLFFTACGSQTDAPATTATTNNTTTTTDTTAYDATKGEGKFSNISISPKLDVTMAEAGHKIYNVKCNACHKLTSERLVGPGWAGITKRKSAEWVMNFVTNTDAMLSKDPEAKKQLEVCLVRMPNQNLSDDDARHIFEFMRKNDGVK